MYPQYLISTAFTLDFNNWCSASAVSRTFLFTLLVHCILLRQKKLCRCECTEHTQCMTTHPLLKATTNKYLCLSYFKPLYVPVFSFSLVHCKKTETHPSTIDYVGVHSLLQHIYYHDVFCHKYMVSKARKGEMFL